MKKQQKFLFGRRRGITLIWTAVVLLAIVGFIGLSLDTARVYLCGNQLQNAADAAALAGARLVRIKDKDPIGAAYNIATSNWVYDGLLKIDRDKDIQLIKFNREDGTWVLDSVKPNGVRVITRRTSDSPAGMLPLLFGGIFGVSESNLTRDAIAIHAFDPAVGLLILDRYAPDALHLDSNARIIIDGGGIHVRSESETAVTLDSNAQIDADSLDIVGSYAFNVNCEVDIERLRDHFSPAMEDPYANLPAPSFGVDRGKITNSASNIAPGYYSGGFDLQSNSVVTLQPGIYVLDGAGLHMESNTIIRGDNVMLYITGTGSINLRSNAQLPLTPSQEGDYKGIAIFQDRNNTNPANLNSNGDLGLEGTVYLPSATLHMDSNAGNLGSELIINRLDLNSNAVVTIDSSSKVTSGGSYLVE